MADKQSFLFNLKIYRVAISPINMCSWKYFKNLLHFKLNATYEKNSENKTKTGEVNRLSSICWLAKIERQQKILHQTPSDYSIFLSCSHSTRDQLLAEHSFELG